MTEPHGTIGDEAAKLLDAVQDWARRNLGSPDSGSHIATGAPECQWCPLCQLIMVLRGDRPEISEKIADATASVVAAVRTLIDAATTHTDRPQPRVQRIDLGEGEG
jgi:hypothetical protein